MKFIIQRSAIHPERGWYVLLIGKSHSKYYYLWKDLELHIGTGFRYTGFIRGYYKSKELAKTYLQLFKEKHNMADQIEITVKVNGIETPLHKINKQTLLTIRENSKPKEVPVARIANYPGEPEERRLLLRMPSNIAKFINDATIAVDLKSGNIVGSQSIAEYEAKNALFYDNVKIIK